nr:HU family DNA-binding protein [Glaciimonas sp. PAMC28666]
MGFGIFSLGKRAVRRGRNSSTGGVIEIGIAQVPKFKLGKAPKDTVN